MKSELWQRLRQARRFADLTQSDLAAKCGVTRGAVALWEAAEAEHRTRPTTEHLITVSDVTGVPLDWLLNDAADLEAVWRVGMEFNDARRAPGTSPRPAKAAPVAHNSLPDLLQNGHLFVFANTPEQASDKLAQLLVTSTTAKKHLVLISPDEINLHTVDTATEALSFVVHFLTQQS